jgi:DNA-binding NtrC family response regulator
MDTTKPKVLFVDDEVSILKGFKLNLGRKYEVFTADSGSEGLRILEEEGPIRDAPNEWGGFLRKSQGAG